MSQAVGAAGGEAADQHEAPHTGLPGAGDEPPGPHGVDPVVVLLAAGAGYPGGVNHRIHALQGAGQVRRFFEVERDDFGGNIGEPARTVRIAGAAAHLVADLLQDFRDVAADESGGAGNEDAAGHLLQCFLVDPVGFIEFRAGSLQAPHDGFVVLQPQEHSQRW